MTDNNTERTPFKTRSTESFGDLPPVPGWLRKPHFPLGVVTCVDGREGIGKGLLATNLALQVLRGGRDVLWFPAEDNPEYDIHRRLLAAGWNRGVDGNAHFYDGPGLYLPEAAMRLLATMKRTKSLGLVILDPGRTYLRNPETRQARYSQDEDMRPGLQELNKLASVSKVPVMFIHHWNRSLDRSGSDRYSGAGSFTQVPRQRVTMGWDEGTGQGAYAVTKANNGPRGFVRSYRVTEVREVESARWEDTGSLPDKSFDEWWARVSKPREVVESPQETLEWYLHANYLPGDPIPGRDALVGASGISQMRVKDGLAALREAGKVSQNGGKSLLWTPEGPVDH